MSPARRTTAWFSTLFLVLALSPILSASAASSGVYRVLLNPTSTPATSQYVSWSRTKASKSQSVTVVAPDGKTSSFAAKSKRSGTKKYAGRKQHRYVAKLGGLTPDTQYRYRIKTRTGVTSWRAFRTAPAAGGSFSFLQFGDTQVKNAGVPEGIIDAATAAYPDAQLMLHAGDVVNHPWVGKEWDDLAKALSPSGQSKSWMASIGNHEQCVLVKKCRSGNAQGFRSYFHGAYNNYPKQRQTWFYSDYGAVRFIVLDTFAKDLDQQKKFLESALKNNTRDWSIVLMHSGPFASRSDRNNSKMRNTFLATFEKHGVDLVLSGHDHSYARGTKAGITYVTSVSGPKYYSNSKADWTRGGANRLLSARRTSTYQIVTVTEEEIWVQAVVAHRAKGATPGFAVGQVLDSFTISKRP